MRKFKKILPFILFTTLGLGSLVGCGEVDPIEEEKPGENEDNGNNENGNEGEGNEGDGEGEPGGNEGGESGGEGEGEIEVPDDKEPDVLTRYDFVINKLKKNNTSLENIEGLYSTNLDYIETTSATNVYSYTESAYALCIGIKREGGSLTFNFKEDIYIKNISFDVTKIEDRPTAIKITAGKKNLTQNIDGNVVTFTGVNKYTKTLTIARGDVEGEVGANRFYLNGFEINGSEEVNIPKVKTSRIAIDSNITGGTVKFNDYSSGLVSLNSEITLKITPTGENSLKTLVVNDGTSDLDIINDKKFTILKENVTYTVKATFGIIEDNTPAEAKNFKVTFDTFTSNSPKFDVKIANDPSKALKSLSYSNIYPNQESDSLQIGDKNNNGSITFKLEHKVIINKFTLDAIKGIYGAIAKVTLGTTVLEIKADGTSEFTKVLETAVTTDTIKIEQKQNGQRFNLKGFEVNGNQDASPEETVTKKVEVKCINPTDAHGTIKLEGAELNESKLVEVGKYIIIHYQADTNYSLKEITYKINADGTKVKLNPGHSGYTLKVDDIDGIYIVEAVFVPKKADPDVDPTPETPIATKSSLVFDNVSSDGGKALSQTEIAKLSTKENKEIDHLFPRQVYKAKNDIIKFTGIRIGSDSNLGQLEINLKKKTIINNITLDLTAYDFEKVDKTTQKVTKSKDISRISVILDENIVSGEYDVTTKKLVIPFDSIVASKIILRTNGPKQRCYLRGFEINSDYAEPLDTNASTVNIAQSTNGTVKTIGLNNENKINIGKVVDLIAEPKDGYYLDGYSINDGTSTKDYGKANHLKVGKENTTYTITPTFKLISERDDANYTNNTHIVSFDKVINNTNEHLTNIKSTMTDNSNLISSIDLGKAKIFGGEGLKVNIDSDATIKFNFTREIEIQNLTINLPIFHLDEIHPVTFEVYAGNTLAEQGTTTVERDPLTFTFETPVVASDVSINIAGKDTRLTLNYLIFNDGLGTYDSTSFAYSNFYESTSVNLMIPEGEQVSVKTYPDASYSSETKSGTRYNILLEPIKDGKGKSNAYLIVNGRLCYETGETSTRGKTISFVLETGLNVVHVVFY